MVRPILTRPGDGGAAVHVARDVGFADEASAADPAGLGALRAAGGGRWRRR